MPQILIEDSGNLKHPKNVKSISNTTGSQLQVTSFDSQEIVRTTVLQNTS